MDQSLYKNIFVFVEQRNGQIQNVSLELLNKAITKYKLAGPSNILDVIEMHNIKKLIDNNCRLTK